MNRTISLVQQVQIASPCTAKWDEMIGDDRSRFSARIANSTSTTSPR